MYCSQQGQVGILVGIIAHHLFFIRGEWHVRAHAILQFYAAGVLVLAASLYQLGICHGVVDSLVVSVRLLQWHLVGLFGSICVYRGFFHPLRHFPGPALAKYSKLWHVWKCRNANNYLLLDGLHAEYGDFVRTGPNELTVFHPDGLAIMNRPGDVARSGWYDMAPPSINTIRDQAIHDEKRKVWEPAFAPEAMRNYERRIRKYAIKEAQFIKSSARTLDMNTLLYRFTFSIMGDFAFGKATDESDTDMDWQRNVEAMHDGLATMGALSQAPWLALLQGSLVWLLPRARRSMQIVVNSSRRMAERLATSPTSESRDVMAWLIEDAQRRQQLDSVMMRNLLLGEAFALIAAGGDTTATTLVFVFYHLVKSPRCQHRIRKELLNLVPESARDPTLSSLTTQEMAHLPFLNAVLNETLRLHHPLPTIGSRVVTNPEGVTVGGTRVPPGTNVVAPRWTYGRCEKHYSRATEFIPERWLDQSKLPQEDSHRYRNMTLEKKAFAPWGGGRWACLGKPIALYEMRYLVSLLVYNYDMELPEGDGGQRVEGEYRDCVTGFPGQLDLVFKPRRNSTLDRTETMNE